MFAAASRRDAISDAASALSDNETHSYSADTAPSQRNFAITLSSTYYYDAVWMLYQQLATFVLVTSNFHVSALQFLSVEIVACEYRIQYNVMHSTTVIN